nr:hypothetical protein Iba_chr14aCG21050 [Ipomoea batatas]
MVLEEPYQRGQGRLHDHWGFFAARLLAMDLLINRLGRNKELFLRAKPQPLVLKVAAEEQPRSLHAVSLRPRPLSPLRRPNGTRFVGEPVNQPEGISTAASVNRIAATPVLIERQKADCRERKRKRTLGIELKNKSAESLSQRVLRNDFYFAESGK